MNPSSIRFTPMAGLTGLFCLFAALFAGGCKSMDKPAGASFASVIVVNQTTEKIQAAVITVFQNNGYNRMPQPDDSLVFQRDATRREQIDYAGLVGTQQGEKVAIRVPVQIVPKNPGAYWVQCQAYAICNPGQSIFENSTALFHFQNDPYQKLMDQVAYQAVLVAPTP